MDLRRFFCGEKGVCGRRLPPTKVCLCRLACLQRLVKLNLFRFIERMGNRRYTLWFLTLSSSPVFLRGTRDALPRDLQGCAEIGLSPFFRSFRLKRAPARVGLNAPKSPTAALQRMRASCAGLHHRASPRDRSTVYPIAANRLRSACTASAVSSPVQSLLS